MKKSIAFVIAAGLLGLTVVICKVWVIISFILYLAKDEPFNWTVFWTGISAIIAIILLYVIATITAVKEQKNVYTTYSERGKSKFAQRLEEAQRLQKERQENRMT